MKLTTYASALENHAAEEAVRIQAEYESLWLQRIGGSFKNHVFNTVPALNNYALLMAEADDTWNDWAGKPEREPYRMVWLHCENRSLFG